jgi:UDPglucose 6-dehydrogenase
VSSIGVVGAGVVGLTAAAGFAHLGHDVVCADVDRARIARLQRGDVPGTEPGLAELVQTGLHSERLRFTVGAAGAATNEFVFLCVPTPSAADGSADLGCVEAALRVVAPRLPSGAVLVGKSTMPPGSTRWVVRQVERLRGRPNDVVAVVSNPEFLRAGSSVGDFLHPDRIVIGCDEPETAVRVSKLYRGVEAPLLVTSCASAEMIKYAANSFLATKVSFINAIAALSEAFGADIREVTLGMGYDPRIGFDYLRPGPGYGGSCLPKDTAALIRAAEEAGYGFELLRSVDKVNRDQPGRIVAKILTAAGDTLPGVTVAVWGLTYKADASDLSGSAAVAIVEELLSRGASVCVYDPAGSDRLRLTGERLSVMADPYEACQGAAVLAVLTEWDVFRWLDFEQVRHRMARPTVVDARNLLEPDLLRRCGFRYQGLGR